MSYDIHDWLEGRVFLKDEKNYYYEKNKWCDDIPIIRIDAFDENSRELIRKYQERFFNEEVEFEFKQIVNEFNDRFEKSQFKNLLLKGLIEILDSILFTNSEEIDLDELSENWGLTNFKGTFYITELRRYFRSIYVSGSDRDYSFVSSKFSPHTITAPSPQVMAEVLFLFFQNLQNKSSEKVLVYDTEFWTLETFELFNYLSENLVETTVIKKYSLIFHYLKSINNDKDIIHNYRFKMTKSDYIEFITNKVNSEFSKNGNPKMNPPETDEKTTDFLPLKRLRIEFEKSSEVD
jgi:hypothetical protein